MSASNESGGILSDLKDHYKQLKQIRSQAEKPLRPNINYQNNKTTQLQKPPLNQEQSLHDTIKSGNVYSHILSRSSSFQQSNDHISEFESLQKRYASTVRLLAESLEEQSNLRAVVELTSNPSEIYAILTQEDFSLASYGPLLTNKLTGDLSADDELPVLLRSTKIRSMLLEKEKLLEQMIDLRSRLDQEKVKRSEVEAQLKVTETLFNETQNDLENANQFILELKNQLSGQKPDTNRNSWHDIFAASNNNNNGDDKKIKNMIIAVPPLPEDENNDSKNLTVKSNLMKPPRTPPATHLKYTNNNNNSINNNNKNPIFSYHDFEDGYDNNDDDHVVYDGSQNEYDSENEDDLLQSLDGSLSKSLDQQNDYSNIIDSSNVVNENANDANDNNNRMEETNELSDDDFPADDNEEDEKNHDDASVSDIVEQYQPQQGNESISPAENHDYEDTFHDLEMSSESVLSDDNNDNDKKEEDKVILSIELDDPHHKTAELEVYRHTMPATAALSFLQDHHLPPEYFAPLVRQIETLQKSLLLGSTKNNAEESTHKYTNIPNDTNAAKNINKDNNIHDDNNLHNLPSLDRKRRYLSPFNNNNNQSIVTANSHHHSLELKQGSALSMSLLANDTNTSNSKSIHTKNNINTITNDNKIINKYNNNKLSSISETIPLQDALLENELYEDDDYNKRNDDDVHDSKEEYDAIYNGEDEPNTTHSVDSFLQEWDKTPTLAPATVPKTVSVSKPIKTLAYIPVIPRVAGTPLQHNATSYRSYEPPLPHHNTAVNTANVSIKIANKIATNAHSNMDNHVSGTPVPRTDNAFNKKNVNDENNRSDDDMSNEDELEDLEDDISCNNNANNGIYDHPQMNSTANNKLEISKQKPGGIVRKPVTTAKIPQHEAMNISHVMNHQNAEINVAKRHSFSGLVRKKANNYHNINNLNIHNDTDHNNNIDERHSPNISNANNMTSNNSRVVQSKIKMRSKPIPETYHSMMPFNNDRDNRDNNKQDKDSPKASSFFSFSPLSSPATNTNNKFNNKSSVNNNINIQTNNNNNLSKTRKLREENISETPVQPQAHSSSFFSSFMRSRPSPQPDKMKVPVEKHSKMLDFLHHNNMNNNANNNNSRQKTSLSNNRNAKQMPNNIDLL